MIIHRISFNPAYTAANYILDFLNETVKTWNIIINSFCDSQMMDVDRKINDW